MLGGQIIKVKVYAAHIINLYDKIVAKRCHKITIFVVFRFIRVCQGHQVIRREKERFW